MTALLGGCATTYDLKLPIPGILEMKVRRVDADSSENLRAMVVNQRNYRLDFFRQSKDPYFGKNRWTQSCLDRNQTGEIIESANGISFRATSTADRELRTDQCRDDSIDVVLLVGECRKQKQFYEIVLRGDRANSASVQCPDRLKF